jgi:hypothetical protein
MFVVHHNCICVAVTHKACLMVTSKAPVAFLMSVCPSYCALVAGLRARETSSFVRQTSTFFKKLGLRHRRYVWAVSTYLPLRDTVARNAG